MTFKVGIIGGTGYGGAELLRLLSSHPDVTLSFVTSRGEAGRGVNELWSTLPYIDLQFQHPDDVDFSSVDVVFSAAPNGVAMQSAREIVAAGAKLIDLSADFRFKDKNEYKKWYKFEHACPELLVNAAYGIPELFKEDIKSASVIGCAGCYATAMQIGTAPAVVHGLNRAGATIIADGKSGVSGAGRGAVVANLYGEVSENFRAYNATAHRHGPEVENSLFKLSGTRQKLVFVPHLLPMIRGIETTIYIESNGESSDQIQKIYEDYYSQSAFVEVMPWGSHPETRMVRGTNNIFIALHQQENSNTIIVLVVEDNLIKGAAGQAVQAFNLAFNLHETRGLTGRPLAV